jgi:hypothetical protein
MGREIMEILSLLSVIISAANAYMLIVLRANNAELRDAMRQEMRESEDRMREWINGSFMRVREVNVHMENITRRLNEISNNL